MVLEVAASAAENGTSCGATGAPSRSFWRLSIANVRAGLQPAGYDPLIAELRAKLNVDNVYLVVRCHGGNLLNALQLLHGNLRHQNRLAHPPGCWR